MKTREELRKQSKLCTHCMREESKFDDLYCLNCENWWGLLAGAYGKKEFWEVLDKDPIKI